MRRGARSKGDGDDRYTVGSPLMFLRAKKQLVFELDDPNDTSPDPDQYFKVANSVLCKLANNDPDYQSSDLGMAIRAASVAAELYEEKGQLADAKLAWGLVAAGSSPDSLLARNANMHIARLNQPVCHEPRLPGC